MSVAHAEDALRRDLQGAASWAATAARVGHGYVRGEVPAHYARRTLQTAADELNKLAARVSDDGGSPAMTDQVRAAQQLGMSLLAAVGRGDERAASSIATDLDRRAPRLSPAR